MWFVKKRVKFFYSTYIVKGEKIYQFPIRGYAWLSTNLRKRQADLEREHSLRDARLKIFDHQCCYVDRNQQ